MKPTGSSEEIAFESRMLSGDTLLMMIFMSMAMRDAKHAKSRDFYLQGQTIRYTEYSPEYKGKDYFILVVI